MTDRCRLTDFDFHPTTRVVSGRGTLDRLGTLLAELHDLAHAPTAGVSRVLLVTDRGIVAAGHADRAQATLRAAGFEPVLFDQVQENPTTRHVDAGVQLARHATVAFIVGLGGGSSMDCAKGINFLLTNGGQMQQYRGVGKATRPMLPFVAVPTTAGTGSEAQSFALIADEVTHQKMACGDRKAAARIAILDPLLTLTQPRGVTIAAGLDAVAHAIESHVCTRANALSRMLSREAWRLARHALPRVLAAPDDLEARAAMLLAAHAGGAAIENSMLGAAHACANPLTATFNLTHGLAVAVMLPHVVRFNAPAADARYAELLAAEALADTDNAIHSSARGTAEPAARLADQINGLLARAAVATRLRDHGIPRDALPALAACAAEQWTAGFNPRTLSVADFERLYQEAW
ncbi:MAG: NAD-dependent methanol dehydrogenase [Phycisphaerae bacterium]|nr:NAD-dependent methanol dehydrogenase [Phycisphaerae bacterium]